MAVAATLGGMNCHNCEAINRDEAKFCDNCGTSLKRDCPKCGNELRTAAKFCDQCGTVTGSPRVGASAADIAHTDTHANTTANSYTPAHLAERILASRSAMQGERKQVTVLFADLQGSMGLAEQVDPEIWHQILDEFFAILGDEIHRFEGTINQYTGDGVMALFGAPLAHEDHAQRACHAALALKNRLREFGQRLRAEHGLSASTRIGLNSGDVIVGRIGDDLRMDYTAQGHTVGLAARMESLAEPGHVYLTAYTAEQVEGYFDLRPLGPMNIKGVGEPLPVFALRGSGPLTTRLQRSQQRGLSPFIGRDTEIKALQQAWQLAKSGKGQLTGVCGDGGIGKSRLCFEFVEQLQQTGVPVHRATAVPYGAALPNLPIQTLLRSLFGVSDGDSVPQARQKIVGAMVMANITADDCRQLILEFLEVAPPGSSSQLPPERRQERLGALFADLLPGCGAASVLMIEDMHWLDDSSAYYVQRMLEPLRATPTLLLMNFRPEYHREQLPFNTVVDVLPLTASSMAELASGLLGSELADVAKQIAAKAGGSPFYVEEAVRLLYTSGKLVGSVGNYRLAQSETGEDVTIDFAIPDSVQAILAGRIDALPEALKATLQSAAVIGSSFTSGLLQRVTRLPCEELQAQLSELQRLLFVRSHTGAHDSEPQDGHSLSEQPETQEPHWDFIHPVTQEVAYGTQLKSRRAKLHAEVAEAMTQALGGAEAGAKAARLAHHWQLAEQWQTAGELMLEAGRFAGQTDMHNAAERMRRAVGLLEKADESDAVLWSICGAHASLVRIAPFSQITPEECERHYLAGTKVLERLPEGAKRQSMLAELLISYGAQQVYNGKPDCAVEYTSKALALVREAGDYATEANLRLPVLLAYFSSGRVSEGLTILQEADGSPWGDTPITAENYQSRAMYANLLNANGQLDRGKRDLEQCLKLAEQAGRSLSWVHASLTEWAWYAGRPEGVVGWARKAVQDAESFGSSFFRANAYRALVEAQLMTGQYAEARQLLDRQEAADTRGFALNGARWGHRAILELAEGNFDAASVAAEKAVSISTATSDRLNLCRSWLVQAEVAAALGEPVEPFLQPMNDLAIECGALVFVGRGRDLGLTAG